MWQQRTTQVLADVLRFSIRGALLLNGILASVASVYFVAKFLFYFLRYVDRTLFNGPW